MTQPEARRSVTALLTIGGLIGLLARGPMLFSMGTNDMNVYYYWARNALDSSLPSTYHGIYFLFSIRCSNSASGSRRNRVRTSFLF